MLRHAQHLRITCHWKKGLGLTINSSTYYYYYPYYSLNIYSILISSKSIIFGIPPHFRTSLRAIRTLPTYDIVSAAIIFSSKLGSDRILISNGMPSKSTIALRTSVFTAISDKMCKAPKRHFVSLLSSKLTRTSKPPMSWMAYFWYILFSMRSIKYTKKKKQGKQTDY